VFSLPVLNAAEAKFECTFGRGCDGICCKNGRPPVYPDERARIARNLGKFLPHLRPEARELVEQEGFVSNRRHAGQPMLRVVGGWCVFFNEGCVLHKVGATEGDKYRYKPYLCAVFPLNKSLDDEWYVRQWGYKNEEWDLFCLNPQACRKRAVETIAEEMALAVRTNAAEARAQRRNQPKR
jgi:hypothetical protein